MNNSANMIIDLDKVKENAKTLIDTYGDYKYLLASVKNNAFGMGLEIIKTYIANGINYLFVTSFKEALAIRQINHHISILVNEEISLDEVFEAVLNNITITISRIDTLKELVALKLKDSLKIHLLLDNGHNKRGLKNKVEINTAVDLIRNSDKLILEGIYTEFMTYGIIDEYYYEASSKFYGLVKDFAQDLIIHINEPGMYHHKNKLTNGLRFDLTLLGIEENVEDTILNKIKIKNIEKKYNDLLFPNISLDLVFKIESEIMDISRAYKNTLIGNNYLTKEDLNVAVVPIGHKDGLTKALNNVYIKNKKCLIFSDEIDYFLVYCPHNAKIGDRVKIIDEETNIYEVINNLKTNRYYLMSILNNNLNRVYVNEQKDTNLL